MPEPLMQDDVVEKVARAMYDASHRSLKSCYSWDEEREPHQEHIRERYLREARAALAAHDLAVGERIERLTKALSEICDLSSDNYDSDRAWALAMQLRARCELHGWLEQRGVK
jgi:hypothetical protein